MDRARKAGVASEVVLWSDHPGRAAFSMAVADAVEAGGAKGVVLAGFMRILAPVFVDRFPNRILNVHPSLLPDFPGAHAVEAALAAGVPETGVTVHFVDEEVDHGPVIARRGVPVEPGDTVEALHARIQEVEHSLYPEVVRAFVSGRLAVEDGEVVGL